MRGGSIRRTNRPTRPARVRLTENRPVREEERKRRKKAIPKRSGGEPRPGKKKRGGGEAGGDTFSIWVRKVKETCCCCCCDLLYLFFCQVNLSCSVVYCTILVSIQSPPFFELFLFIYYYCHYYYYLLFIIIFPFSSQLPLQPYAAQSTTRKTRPSVPNPFNRCQPTSQ